MSFPVIQVSVKGYALRVAGPSIGDLGLRILDLSGLTGVTRKLLLIATFYLLPSLQSKIPNRAFSKLKSEI
jgi:hypothetical protein